MSKKTDICLICLRTDKEMKIIDKKISDFHAELCDYSVYVCVHQYYCSECEHLLKKTYKFREKCIKACNILKEWIKSINDSQPITSLCTLLPSTLSVWTPVNMYTYQFVHQETSVLPEPQNLNLQTYALGTEKNGCGNLDIDSQNLLINSNSQVEIKRESDEIQNNLPEKDSVRYIKDLIDLKNEEFEEILSKGNDNLANNESVNDDVLSDFGFSDDDDDKLIYLKNTLSKNEDKPKLSKRKRCYDESSLEDGSNKDVKRKKIFKMYMKRNVVKKKKICKEVAKENDIDNNKKTRFHTRKEIYKELTNMLCCENSESREEDEKNSKLCKKRPYSKERLIEEVRSKFASHGEVKAADGTVIDKDFILQCLDDKVTDYVLRQLYNAVHRKLVIKPKALKIFKCIQNKYKSEYSSIFDIEYLNTKEKIIEEFEKRKTYESYITAEFKCEVCYQGFKHEKKLLNHQKCHKESAGAIICSICKVRQRGKKSLISHMNSMHEAVYRCKLCPLVTYYKSSMQNHYQQHKGVKYTCKECNTIFASVSSFRTHMSYRHARDHVCTSCGQAYNTRVGLQIHTTKEHQNEGIVTDLTVKCDECSLSFASSEAYHKHIRVTHKRVIRGRPPGTTVRFRSDRPRKRAVVTCRVCNSVGGSWGWLSLHFSLEHPTLDLEQTYADKNQHLCDICGKSFSTIYTLQAHLNVHSGARPFACESCNARFHRALSLRLHRLVHRPPSKPCALCGKKFRSHSNLHNHMRSHIGDRRYKCAICGKGFIHRNSLNEHVRGVHKNIRRVRKRGVTDGTTRSLTLDRSH